MTRYFCLIRKFEPFKGTYDLLGGFVDPNESAEEAAIRELKEETGLDIKIKSFFGSYPDIYGPNGKFTLGVCFIVNVVGGQDKAHENIEKLEWIAIKDIPKLENLGFENIKKTLADFYKKFT